jgi:hypothetical protein
MNHDEVEDWYSDKNKDYFFQNLFDGTEAENCAIANEIKRLCVLLPYQYRKYFQEVIEILQFQANKHSQGSPALLSAVYDHIKQNKLITSNIYAVKAFLATSLLLASYNKTKFDQYKALSLVVVTYLSFKGEHDSKIGQLCNEIRQYAMGKREKLAPYLPNTLTTTFSRLIAELSEIEQYSEIQQSNIKHQLGKIRVPFRDSYEDRSGFTRQGSSREYKGNSVLQTFKPQMWIDSTETSVTEIKELRFNTTEEKQQAWGEEESLSTTQSSLSVVYSNQFVEQEQSTLYLKAKAINERVRKKAMALTCDIFRMTSYELQCLTRNCISSIQHSEQDSECARALLLMLILGNSFSELIKTKFKRKHSKIIGVKRRFLLPSQKLREEISPLAQPVISNYDLPLPLNLVDGIKNITFNADTEANIKNYLSHLNKKHGLHLTPTKISGYLSQTLNTYGIDGVLVDLITGYLPQNRPARFYTHIPYCTLLGVYEKYVLHINSAGGNDFLRDKEEVLVPKIRLGSPLYINDSLLCSLFHHIELELNSQLTDHITSYSESAHNLKILKLQLILGFSSGYRPVEGWFGYTQDIHFPTGEYRIAEKERQLSYSGRVILLPHTALEALKSYLSYCEEACIYFAISEPLLSSRYRQSINSLSPFCFYRHQGKIQEVTPSSYAQHIDPIFPLQANWARHHLRSFLFERQISDEVIGAWMGHIHSNQLPFAQFSQLRRQELTTIQLLLETQLKCWLKEGKP